MTLDIGTIPAAFNTAKVITIHKQGHKGNIENYRPISILPYFSKLHVKVVYVKLYDYINKHNLSPYQHSFQPGHSMMMS